MISSAVQTFLTTPNTGILMISGQWGSGKSFFVRNKLLNIIRETHYCGAGDSEKTYLPIMISVFGKSSVKDLESAIMGKWVDVVSNNQLSKIESVMDFLGKQLKRSKKLNEYLDIASILEYRPGIKILPKNVVIILDDLERFDDKISEAEILGLINNLNENHGLKVIVIANEDYLNANKSKFGQFKEKVVEKTLLFKPDIHDVVVAMVGELKDDKFSNYITGSDLIMKSFDAGNSISPKDSGYARCLSNLRTIKFSINHFYIVFKAIEKQIPQGKTIADYNEELTHFWFSILAIAIELKSHRLSNNNIHILESFHYIDSALMIFNGGDPDVKPNPFDKMWDKMAAQNEEKENKQKSLDVEYGRTFYEYYFRSRGCNLLPIANPELLQYIVNGKPLNVSELMSHYHNERTVLTAEGTTGDKLLEKFMHGLLNMNNTEVASNIASLLIETGKGNFTRITNFVNATTYLFCFKLLLPDSYNDVEILETIKKGVNEWFKTNTLTDSEKTRFNSIKGMADNNQAKLIHSYIENMITKLEDKQNSEEIISLIGLFKTDTIGFCTKICPQAFMKNSGDSIGITWYMKDPILHHITDEDIKEKANTITISDSEALSALLNHRYSLAEKTQLKGAELNFWEKLCQALLLANVKTAGMIIAQHNLLPKIARFIM